jgi:hypothetical protein
MGTGKYAQVDAEAVIVWHMGRGCPVPDLPIADLRHRQGQRRRKGGDNSRDCQGPVPRSKGNCGGWQPNQKRRKHRWRKRPEHNPAHRRERDPDRPDHSTDLASPNHVSPDTAAGSRHPTPQRARLADAWAARRNVLEAGAHIGPGYGQRLGDVLGVQSAAVEEQQRTYLRDHPLHAPGGGI